MSRADIYYWKCDRPSAFQTRARMDEADMACWLGEALKAALDDPSVELHAFDAPGNHRAWKFSHEKGQRTSFVRVEDGPEVDDYLLVESHLLDEARRVGVPTPRLIAVDTSREQVPFAWQAIEWIDEPSLDHWHRSGRLDVGTILSQLGEMLARLQQVPVSGFGAFSTMRLAEEGVLQGHHDRYPDYYFLHLDCHLDGLIRGGLIDATFGARIRSVMRECQDLLTGFSPVLVHKDIALWNLLGKPDRITSVIDWDDAIGGDPVDDLSLVGCFFPRSQVDEAIRGYEAHSPLPPYFEARYALHLLRNLIFKALIRLRTRVFEKGDENFLIPPGSTGASLRTETIERMQSALRNLEESIA